MGETYIRKSNTKCFVCNKGIYRRPSKIKASGSFYCGQKCYGIAQRKEKPCVVCGTLIMSSLHRKTCSRSCSNIHRTGIKYLMNRPRDKVKSQQILKLRLLKQRGTLCERCQYSKYEILQIHHKDRDRSNNELENLELICPNCHYEEHFLSKSWLRKKVVNI
ncbi:MAG: nuclease [Parcubacteria group bacterium]|nr:nuclease [Parcubacteria group bacterium]